LKQLQAALVHNEVRALATRMREKDTAEAEALWKELEAIKGSFFQLEANRLKEK
jgi:hypothetical protein